MACEIQSIEMHLRHNMDTKYYITQDNQKWDIQSVQQEQEGQHPLTGQRAANFRLLANQ